MNDSTKPIDENNVLADVSDTLTDKAIKFKVQVLNLSRVDKLQIWLGIKKPFREFSIRPSCLGTLVKISKELLAMDLKHFDNKNLIESNYELIDQQSERMARVISMAIINSKEDPPGKMISFFMNNLSAAELNNLVAIVVKNIDVLSFMKSIISLKGTSLLKSGMNPVEQRSQIASGEQSVE